MWVGICKGLLTVLIIAHICVRVVTTSHCQCPSRVQFIVLRKQSWDCTMLSCLHTCRTVNKQAAQMNIAASLGGPWPVTAAAAV